jgi:hypothetical protein
MKASDRTRLLIEVWKWRRDNPQILTQPIEQWPKGAATAPARGISGVCTTLEGPIARPLLRADCRPLGGSGGPSLMAATTESAAFSEWRVIRSEQGTDQGSQAQAFHRRNPGKRPVRLRFSLSGFLTICWVSHGHE